MKLFKHPTDNLFPYNLNEYLSYLDEISNTQYWKGYSIQLKNHNFKSDEDDYAYDDLASLHTKLLRSFNDTENWILNHEYKQFPWFKNFDYKFYKENDLLFEFKKMLSKNNIGINEVGFLQCDGLELKKVFKDLYYYPSILSYKDIDISNQKIELIFKCTHHLTIDVLSTSHKIIDRILAEIPKDKFIIKPYDSN